MHTLMIRFATVLAAALVLAVGAPPAQAEGYPAKPVRIVVPYAAGGSTDFVSRLFAKRLSDQLGQAVVVENRPGAATNVGSDVVAKAAPDGSTLLISDGAHTWNAAFGPAPPFDPVAALVPIALIAQMPFVVAANPKFAFNDIKELVGAARAAPGKYTIASASVRVFVELMNSRASMKLLHVPYKGGALATGDAIGGQVDMVFAALPALSGALKGGKLKPLGVTSSKRSAALPAVPTLQEAGVDYDISIQYVLYAPAGTPAPIVERLAQATQKIVAEPDFVQRLLTVGGETAPSTPAALLQSQQHEVATWREIAQKMPELVELRPKGE
jgi:tripartite-type tricarboxylate transporter receptor subunit TctC